eukprot:PhF_6_TR28076/c2_g1_i2/m.41478
MERRPWLHYNKKLRTFETPSKLKIMKFQRPTRRWKIYSLYLNILSRQVQKKWEAKVSSLETQVKELSEKSEGTTSIETGPRSKSGSSTPHVSPEREKLLALQTELDAVKKRSEQQLSSLNMKNMELRNMLQEAASQMNPELTIDKRIVTAMILNFLRVAKSKDHAGEKDVVDVMAHLLGWDEATRGQAIAAFRPEDRKGWGGYLSGFVWKGGKEGKS